MAESIGGQTTNPLSKKLNKILDNRFDSDKVSKRPLDNINTAM